MGVSQLATAQPSTAASRHGRGRPDPRPAFRRFWHEYTRMRTAIVFLIGLILIVLVGSFVPQQDTSAQTAVDAFTEGHHNLSVLSTTLGFPLTEVFVSPVFFALLGSLYVALGACVIRRGRALIMRTVRGYPRTPQYWGEWGSWTFHTSFFLLLIAVVAGKATGFEGIVTIVEGQRVTESAAAFDTLRQGFLFDGHHAGYQVQLDRFSVGYQSNGAPADFVSSLSVYDNGHQVASKDVRVNDFLNYAGVDFYQQDYGFAPHLVVLNPRGETVYDGAVEFFGQQRNVSVGVLKVAGFDYTLPGQQTPLQVGAKMALFPDAQTTAHIAPDGSVDPSRNDYAPGGQEARNPVLQVSLFVGDLGLARGPQSVNALDTSTMQPYYSGGASVALPLHSELRLPLAGSDCSVPTTPCMTLRFDGIPQYSVFHVKKDTGVPLVYISFGLVMVGLLTKLYLRPVLEARGRRRKVRSGEGYGWLASTGSAEGSEGAAARSSTAKSSGEV